MIAEPASPRLLYLDRDEAVALPMARDLGAQGIDVTHLAAAPALGMVRDYDAVLLGQGGATIAGDGALEALREEAPGLPVVQLVASDGAGVLLTALEQGAHDAAHWQDDPHFAALIAARVRRAITQAADRRAATLARTEAQEAREKAAVLLNEMKHRIANSLALVVSMAHLQAGSMDRGEAQRAVDEFADKVHALAQVHKGLYASMTIGTVALDTYLTQLVGELRRNHVGRRAISDLAFECLPLSVSVDQAISIGVILSEFVSNAARFAYPGRKKGPVRAVLRRDAADQAALIVEDDGAGIGEGEARPGLGSQIVGVLAQGLGGWFELKPRDRGMQAVLHFPLPGES